MRKPSMERLSAALDAFKQAPNGQTRAELETQTQKAEAALVSYGMNQLKVYPQGDNLVKAAKAALR